MKYLKTFEDYEDDNKSLYIDDENLFNLDDYLPFPLNLEEIMCSNNNLQILPILPNKLRSLKCSHNDLIELPILPNTLEILYCHHNKLEELSELPESLRLLYYGYNDIKKHPIKYPINLSQLGCNNTNLESLVKLPPNLKTLSCNGNKLTKLPTLPETLENLYCNNNNLTELPVLPDTLIHLNCGYNDWIKPIKYEYMDNFNLVFLDVYTNEQIRKFTSFEFQKEFLEREPENYFDLKPIGYANGIEDLFPHLFDMDELGLID